jgi:hypothetical protein
MNKIPKLFAPLLLMSTAFALTCVEFQTNKKEIDLSAFANFANNIGEIVKTNEASLIIEDNRITANIIKTIDKEISKKIARNIHIQKLAKKDLQHEVLPQIHIAESSIEINNSALIELYGISSDRLKITKFDNTVFDITDEVKVAASAPVPSASAGPIEPVEPVLENQDNQQVNSENEMPMFEYAEVRPAGPYDRALSPTVKETISRVVGKMPKKLVEKKEKKAETISDDNDQIVYDYSKAAKQISKKSSTQAFSTNSSKSFEINAYGIDIGGEKPQAIMDFNFVPDYDREERVNSAVNGIAKLNYNLTTGVNTQTGIIEAQGKLSTRVEVNLSTQDKMIIPMLSEEEVEKLYPGKNLLLLAIDSGVQDVEIDTSFTDKVFYNENFKHVTTQSEARFVMFAGMRSGNILLKYFLTNKETAQKVIYLGEREMYFEEASFTAGEREHFSFTSRNLMSSKKTELTIAPELITVFNTAITSKKHTLNSYELKMPTFVSGSRKYIEMKHLNDSIFVGTDVNFEIDLPNNEFIARVLEANQVNSLKEHCVVQLNISKPINGITVNGKNHSGEMYTETTFLDEDGKFSKTDFEQAEKAFITGDSEGIFNVKLEYSDESIQFLKTYCSEGTYIVEEL